MTRCLRLSSLVLFLLTSACSTPYADLLTPAQSNYETAIRYRPLFEKHLYRTNLQGNFLFKGFHLSGVLFLKTLPDSSTRVVFQNEMGYTFFDFGWTAADSFVVYSIMPGMDKPALVKTLRKDFEAFLMKGLDTTGEAVFLKRNGAIVHRFGCMSGFVYYVKGKDRHRRNKSGLYDIDISGKRRLVASISLYDKNEAHALPEQFTIQHWGITHSMTIWNTTLYQIDTTSDAE